MSQYHAALRALAAEFADFDFDRWDVPPDLQEALAEENPEELDREALALRLRLLEARVRDRALAFNDEDPGRCDECGAEEGPRVVVGETEDYESSTATLCQSCALRAAGKAV